MKKLILSFVAVMLFASAFAQEAESKFGISSDIVSRYVWRGTQFSTSAAIQPGMSFSTGGFTAGAWGSYALDASGTECDLYASYAFDFGLTVVANDYFFPNDVTGFTDSNYGVVDSTTTHFVELGASYTFGKLTLSAYKMLNQDKAFYAEAGFAFNDNISATVGAGDQAYSLSQKFNVVNLGLKFTKEVALSDRYSLKPYASFIVNPNQEQVFLVVGVTL